LEYLSYISLEFAPK